MNCKDKTGIRGYYEGRSVFATGATGFLGKVLIEKLLRSFPKIDKVYILIRAKKGKTAQERIDAITGVPLFDKLRKEYPNVIKDKLRIIEGDVLHLSLGISEDDRKELIENVSVVFHGAATVRFDDPLKHAVLVNTRGTREVINLALQMKKLEVFIHISTTYCNTDRREVDEMLYPPHADWRKVIETVEGTDDHVLNVLTMKYTDVLPNTYTFTKALSEHCVYDMCNDKIPTCICRPSVVISTKSDPVPGWIDNFNGPIGLLAASAKGILRTSCINPKVRSDLVPVDRVVRALLLASWSKATNENVEEKMQLEVFNCSNNLAFSLTTGELIEFGRKTMWEAPPSQILWCPGGGVTANRYLNYIKVIFLHLLPALIVDNILKVLKHKPLLVKIQRRIYIANLVLQYFTNHQWSFPNNKCLELDKKLVKDEVEDFSFDLRDVDVYDYFRDCYIHGRRYLLNEDDANIGKAIANAYRLYVLDKVLRGLVLFLIIWYFVFEVDILTYICYKGFNYILE